MAKFRNKPIVIEAVQWFKMGDHPAVLKYEHNLVSGYGWLNTLDGGHIVSPGDWIIKGVMGTYSPCRPGIFKTIYEPAE